MSAPIVDINESVMAAARSFVLGRKKRVGEALGVLRGAVSIEALDIEAIQRVVSEGAASATLQELNRQLLMTPGSKFDGRATDSIGGSRADFPTSGRARGGARAMSDLSPEFQAIRNLWSTPTSLPLDSTRESGIS